MTDYLWARRKLFKKDGVAAMSDASAAGDGATPESGSKKRNVALLSMFSISHGVFHFLSQAFSIMVPAIKETFGINPVQVGVIITAKTLAGGLASLPGGMVSDYFRRYRGRLMFACMIVFALGWLLVGASPVYPLLIIGMVVVAIAGSVWHLPSMAELGVQFSKTRGATMAVYGAGGTVGDILGPVLTGVLLGYLSWRGVISIYAIIPFLMAFAVAWVLKGRDDGKITNGGAKTASGEKADIEPESIKLQIKAVKEIMKKTHIWRINVVAGFRGMCFDIISAFFPLIMKEELGLSSTSIGFHFGLLWTIGIIVSPVMGYLSDRYNRKVILVPALLYSSLLIVALALFGKGIAFTILLALLGVSVRSDYSILTAAILDIVGDKIATTMLGVFSFTRFMMAAAAPVIAGALYQYVGMKATLYFVAALFAISGIIFSTVDLKKK